jgi:hypothetical protein
MAPAPLAEVEVFDDDIDDLDDVFEGVGLDDGLGIGAGLDFWFGGGRIWGLNLEGTWKGWDGWDNELDDDIDFGQDVQLWQYDASLALRLTTPDANTKWLPWLSVGVGGITVNPEDDPLLFPTPFCAGGVDADGDGIGGCAFTSADVFLDTGSHTEVAFVPGIGMDFFLSSSVALRLEAKDYWTDDSPYLRLSDGTAHDGGHNWLFNGGLAFYWGGRRVVEPGFVREEPIVEPPPPPPPPPAETRTSVCVVDPNGFQVRTIDAIAVPSEQKMYVMRNGQRVEIETAYPATTPIYVRSANWYMNDRPLVVNLETGTTSVPANQRNRLELVLFGSPAQRNAADLVFIGTIEGTPIYADRTDISAFRPRLEAKLATTKDLGEIMRGDADLAREIGAVDSYYVAVEPNCVFQPMSVTHFVRRTRG